MDASVPSCEGQIVATSHDRKPPQKVAFWKGHARLFQGNLGGGNIIIWPESSVLHCLGFLKILALQVQNICQSMIFVGDRYCPKNLQRLHYFFLIWWISILQFLRKFFNFRVSPWNLHRHSLTKTITVDELHQLGSTNLETGFFKCCTPTYAHFFGKKGILNRMMG